MGNVKMKHHLAGPAPSALRTTGQVQDIFSIYISSCCPTTQVEDNILIGQRHLLGEWVGERGPWGTAHCHAPSHPRMSVH